MAVLTRQRTTCDRCGSSIETENYGPSPAPILSKGWVHVTATLSSPDTIGLNDLAKFATRRYDFCLECWPKVRTVPQSPGSITWEPHKP